MFRLESSCRFASARLGWVGLTCVAASTLEVAPPPPVPVNQLPGGGLPVGQGAVGQWLLPSRASRRWLAGGSRRAGSRCRQSREASPHLPKRRLEVLPR